MAIILRPRGPFSLTAAATYVEGFPGSRVERSADALRYAWAVDEEWRTVQATLRQDGETVRVELTGRPPPALVERAVDDLKQMLCLGVDGAGFAALGLCPSASLQDAAVAGRKADQIDSEGLLCVCM